VSVPSKIVLKRRLSGSGYLCSWIPLDRRSSAALAHPTTCICDLPHRSFLFLPPLKMLFQHPIFADPSLKTSPSLCNEVSFSRCPLPPLLPSDSHRSCNNRSKCLRDVGRQDALLMALPLPAKLGPTALATRFSVWTDRCMEEPLDILSSPL